MKKIKVEVELNIPDYWLENGEPSSETKADIANDIKQRLSALEVEGMKMNCAYNVLKINEIEEK